MIRMYSMRNSYGVIDISDHHDKSKYFQSRQKFQHDSLQLFKEEEFNNLFIENEINILNSDFDIKRYKYKYYYH